MISAAVVETKRLKPLLLTIALLLSIVSDSYAENDEEFVEELTVGYMLDNKDKSDVFYRIIGTMHGILFSEVYFQDKEYRKKSAPLRRQLTTIT